MRVPGVARSVTDDGSLTQFGGCTQPHNPSFIYGNVTQVLSAHRIYHVHILKRYINTNKDVVVKTYNQIILIWPLVTWFAGTACCFHNLSTVYKTIGA